MFKQFKNVFFLVIMLAVVPPLLSQRLGDYRDPGVTYNEGWTTIFNGKDFSDWVVVLQTPDKSVRAYLEGEIDQQSTFYIKDGLLCTTGSPNGYVRTVQAYDNYVIHVEFRYSSEGGNSGVLLHIQRDEVWPTAIEAQLYQSHLGRIYPIGSSVRAKLDGGEMFHEAAHSPGEWNTLEVYSEEGRVATVLNGKLVGLASNAEPRIGYIGLQAAGAPLQFRNVKIRRHIPVYPLRDVP